MSGCHFDNRQKFANRRESEIMRKNRKFGVKALFGLMVLAAVLIKLWPSFVVLGEAGHMYFRI